MYTRVCALIKPRLSLSLHTAQFGGGGSEVDKVIATHTHTHTHTHTPHTHIPHTHLQHTHQKGEIHTFIRHHGLISDSLSLTLWQAASCCVAACPSPNVCDNLSVCVCLCVCVCVCVCVGSSGEHTCDIQT